MNSINRSDFRQHLLQHEVSQPLAGEDDRSSAPAEGSSLRAILGSILCQVWSWWVGGDVSGFVQEGNAVQEFDQDLQAFSLHGRVSQFLGQNEEWLTEDCKDRCYAVLTQCSKDAPIVDRIASLHRKVDLCIQNQDLDGMQKIKQDVDIFTVEDRAYLGSIEASSLRMLEQKLNSNISRLNTPVELFPYDYMY